MVLESLKHIHLHTYWKNKDINNFYTTMFIINFGIALISLFVPIYLYKLGYEIYKIVFFFFLWSLYYAILLYPGAKFISKIGAKHSMFISCYFLIAYYLGLNFLPKFSFLFLILPLIKAISTMLFWNPYHIIFYLHSNKKKRASEISFIYILMAISISIAPFFGGLIATKTFSLLFSIGSFFIFTSMIPLFLTKEDYIPKNFNFKKLCNDIFSKREKRDVISFTGYAIENILQAIIWPIFILMILGTYVKTGLIVSLTSFISLIALYFSGIISEKYNKIKIIKITTILHSLGWIFRIFVNSTGKIFFVDTYKVVAEKFLHIPWAAQIYDLAGKRDYFEFIIFKHFVYHLIRIIILPFIILIFYIDFHPFTISFIIAAIFSTFYAFINKK